MGTQNMFSLRNKYIVQIPNPPPLLMLSYICFFVILGVQAFADALLVIIKVLAQNSGLDPQEAIVKLQEEYTGPGQAVGLDIKTGKSQNPSRVFQYSKYIVPDPDKAVCFF